jgi:hypothetical protein
MTNYIDTIQDLLAQGRTTGANQSESMIHYTAMNLKRLKRWNKTGKLIPEMYQAIEKVISPQKWVIITEAWCGDAAHTFMFLEKIAQANENIELIWKLRDENLDLMDLYLTNGSRSIPKLIVYDEDGIELFNWGPRPKHIQEARISMSRAGLTKSEITVELQKLYNADKGEALQRELLELMG